MKNLSRILLGLHMAVASYCVLAGWLDAHRRGAEWMISNAAFPILLALGVVFPVIALAVAATKRRRTEVVFFLAHVGLGVAQYYGLLPLKI
jgi:hypothetical protein